MNVKRQSSPIEGLFNRVAAALRQAGITLHILGNYFLLGSAPFLRAYKTVYRHGRQGRLYLVALSMSQNFPPESESQLFIERPIEKRLCEVVKAAAGGGLLGFQVVDVGHAGDEFSLQQK